jgi:hypothetical protein
MQKVDAATWAPQRITLYCGAPSCQDHDDDDIAVLGSFLEGGYELWTVVDGGEHQVLIHHDDDQVDVDRLEQVGLVAHRFKLICRRCGYAITAGDLLGIGARSMAFQRAGRCGDRSEVAVPALAPCRGADGVEPAVYASLSRQALMTNLTAVAAAGVPRLSLAVLNRMVRMK